ncbi:hypothetical protein BH24DEI2_BH24DEI2_11850 [soil metagenome]
MPTPFMILGSIYLLVFGLIALSYSRNRKLEFRDLLECALWPLDLVWPFLLAGVATLELCAMLAQRRFEGSPAKTKVAA